MVDKKIIKTSDMSCHEWLNLIFSKKDEKHVFIDYMFPNENIRDEYLDDIIEREEYEVINLIRKFLIPSCTLNSDEINLEFLLHSYNNDKERFQRLMNFEYYKRLKNNLDKNFPVWEGNTWIIDLLPHHPQLALDALHAYFIAHIQFLPDGRFSGIQDAMTLIRTKFINTPYSDSEFPKLSPEEFEHLIESLYYELKYETKMTKKTRDGGRDIIAEKKEAGQKELLLISCKATRNYIDIEKVRSLLAVVTSDKATKGSLVTNARFSPDAKTFAKDNPTLELIDGNTLKKLLNKNFGSKWQLQLDYLITSSLKRNENRI